MGKKSKKTTGKQNFYLAILSRLKHRTNLSKIQEDLDISKQQLNYYLRQLKKKGFIYNKGYGWWEVTNKSKNTTKYGIFLKKDTIRGHAYIWEVKLPQEIKGWDNRLNIIKKKKINYKLVGALKSTPRIKALSRKVWLCNDHLRIYDTEKSSYYGNTAIESRKNSTMALLRIITTLERRLGFYLRPFSFKVKKEHYALIKNDLAIDQNRKGVIMRIKDEDGKEWLLIDDSLEQGGELETIGKKSLSTNIKVQRWWNDNKKHNFQVTPSFIMDSIAGLVQTQQMNADNIVKHQRVLDEMLITLKKIRDGLDNLTPN